MCLAILYIQIVSPRVPNFVQNRWRLSSWPQATPSHFRKGEIAFLRLVPSGVYPVLRSV
jgi:hypothetical protein